MIVHKKNLFFYVSAIKQYFCKNGRVNQQASADRPVSSLLGLVRTLQIVPNKDETDLLALAC